MARLYEDLTVGDQFQFHEYVVTAEEIREFAEQFDPQPFHLDVEAAADSIFDEIVASGWHTASLSIRMLVDSVFSDVAIMGGRGVNELRWHVPVYPGDILSGYTEIIEKSVIDPDSSRGNVNFAVTVTNQDNEMVLSYMTLSMVRRAD